MSERTIDERDLVRAARRVVETAHAPTAGYQRVHRREIEALAAALATPEPGGDGDEVTTVARMIADAPMMGDKLALARRIVEYLRPTPAASEDVRGDLRGWLVMAADLGRESDAPLETVADDVLVEIERDDPALLRTPRGEGERGLIMRAMLETFPWSPDIRQEHFERAADAVLTALRSEAQGEDEDSLVKEAVALIDEAVSEIAGDCQCYEEDGEVVLCWTCRAMNWSDRAERLERSENDGE